MDLTIENFWRPMFSNVTVRTDQVAKGWQASVEPLPTFMEAPLTVDPDLSAGPPNECPLILIAAPGAVGKSTLAREIAAQTGAVLVDLAAADPVGGNAISGGLAKSNLYAAWQDGKSALIIDGLDEARLRVTQEAFESFLTDIADLAKERSVPTVILGRTGSIQDAWLFLSQHDVEICVLEIGFFDHNSSIDFAMRLLRSKKPSAIHSEVESEAIGLLIEKLRTETETDGDKFAGYAPVLQAVADRVASEDNPAALISDIKKGGQPVTLSSVVLQILERERGKLATLNLQNQDLLNDLYSPTEQLERLAARVYGMGEPDYSPMSPADLEIYTNALQTWLPEHPFLDGNKGCSSAVFEAMITVTALKGIESRTTALKKELGKGAAANPFLAEFYMEEGKEKSDEIPSELIGIFYTSLRARLSIGDTANLSVEGNEEGEDEQALLAEVEISMSRKDSQDTRSITLKSDQTGLIYLGKHIEDVEINAPYANVVIGSGVECLLISPVSIISSQVKFETDKILVESGRAKTDGVVFIECESCDSTSVSHTPIVRGDVKFSVSWPGAKNHPWTAYATTPTPVDDPRIDEALRRFRKFITAFRSHSKGSLARYKRKIEHERMTKGTGRKVLDTLLADQIVTADDSMYHLDSTRLGSITGATYSDAVSRRFNEKTIAYVKSVIDERE